MFAATMFAALRMVHVLLTDAPGISACMIHRQQLTALRQPRSQTHTIMGPRLGRLRAGAAGGVSATASASASSEWSQGGSGGGGGQHSSGALVTEEDGLLPRCVQSLFE